MSRPRDYGSTGVDIQTAMVMHAQENPDRESRPDYILWNGLEVRTFVWLEVPSTGHVRLEFLSPLRSIRQGVDLSVEQGGVALADGSKVPLLRTWHDERYEQVVEYPFESAAGRLSIYNVYEWSWPQGRTTEEKWTGNAGFLLEQEDERTFVFHCSPGPVEVPDFEQLVFRLTILGEEAGS